MMTFKTIQMGPGVMAMRVSHQQRGAALIVALVLLIVVALVGLAGISMSALQSRAASNQYDREVGFQSAESALRVAAALFPSPQTGAPVARDCTTSVCTPNPFTDPNLPPADIQTVVAGTTGTTYTVSGVAPMQPEYVVEYLGDTLDPNSNNGSGNTANSRQYGNSPPPTQAKYYRITARSCDPSKPVCDGRAMVMLQSIIRRD